MNAEYQELEHMCGTETPDVRTPREPMNSKPEMVVDETTAKEIELVKAAAEEAIKIAESAIHNAQAVIALAIATGALDPCECYTMNFGNAQISLKSIRRLIDGRAKQQREATSPVDRLTAFLLSQVTD